MSGNEKERRERDREMEEDIGNEKEIQEDRERRYGGIQSERNGWRKKRRERERGIRRYCCCSHAAMALK